jgi:DNA polymerase-2
MHGFLLTPTYRVVHDVPEVHLYGVLESGEPCLIIDDRTKPYFYLYARDAARAVGLVPGLQLDPSVLQSLDAEPVWRATVRLPGDVPRIRQQLESNGIACLEADVRFAYRYLIDRGIRGSFTVSGHHETHARLGRVYRNPTLKPAQWLPSLRILSIDIETGRGGELYSIALHMNDFERVILIHEHVLPHAEPAHSEKAALRRFLDYVHTLDPDVITGWNVVDFDLTFLLRCARRHGVRFAIGRNDDELDVHKDPNFTREARAVVCGRQVLDGLALMRGAFLKLDDYKLETAAQTFLGRGKLLAGDGRHQEIEHLYHNDPARLVEYNLQDARLVSEILAKTGLIELAIERSLLTGMPLDRVSAAIASIDSLYLGALRQRRVVAPSVGAAPEGASIGGGYVMGSKPGLFRNVLVFDFKSLYPSIIRTFNIDPLTHVRRSAHGVPVVRAPNGAAFRRDVPGIIPGLLAQLAQEREQAKQAGNAVKSHAVKILMNSFYGVLGAAASRLFSPDVANAITSFGQLLIRFAADHAQQRGFQVLYGDTDSLFVHANEPDSTRALQLGETLRRDIGTAVADFVREEHGCESVLELELEKLYHRFFLPELRGGKGGSKKRYAGLLVKDGSEEIEFVGLESVRRDWSEVSKRFQHGLLERVFHDQPVEDFVRHFVADLRGGRFDDQLTYRKAIRKDIEQYTKTTPPHVKAARKLGEGAGRIIAYVMTRNGPEPVGRLTAPPDYDHYCEHQLAPVADAILRFLGTDFESIVQPKRQLRLF